MKKTVAIVQSNYIPWKGYFDLINSVDEFILYDDMQYTRRDWRNRNTIKSQHGLIWLTIPVQAKGKYLQKIKDTMVRDNKWARDHWQDRSGECWSSPLLVDPYCDVAGNDIVVDGRIQAYLLTREGIPCFKVLVDAPLDVRAERIAVREKTSVEAAKREIIARERSEQQRYKKIYGIDLKDTGIFDMVVDTGRKTADAVVAQIEAQVRG